VPFSWKPSGTTTERAGSIEPSRTRLEYARSRNVFAALSVAMTMSAFTSTTSPLTRLRAYTATVPGAASTRS